MADTGPTGSYNWILHPGDWVVAHEYDNGAGYRVLFRTPSDLEMQRHLLAVSYDHPVMVFQLKGSIP